MIRIMRKLKSECMEMHLSFTHRESVGGSYLGERGRRSVSLNIAGETVCVYIDIDQ